MSTTPDTTTDPAVLQATIDKLSDTLRKRTEEHKAEKAATLGPIRKALGLGDDAGRDQVLAALTAKSLSQKGRMGSRLKDRAWNRGAKDGTHQGGGGVAHGVGGAR